ncbi:hypothetical protein AB6A40_003892 [Gnathostoma spinigerum]|uniref:Uncharacterized protein n=1 Tax=Gnathostoma spinigerum TaxID=75299 RepID=A0ABD6EAV7_9BILA
MLSSEAIASVGYSELFWYNVFAAKRSLTCRCRKVMLIGIYGVWQHCFGFTVGESRQTSEYYCEIRILWRWLLICKRSFLDNVRI